MQQIISQQNSNGLLLENVLGQVEQQIDKSSFDVWFRNSVQLRMDGDVLFVGVPNTFVCEYLERRYARVISKALAACCGRELAVKFDIDPSLFQQRRRQEIQQSAEFIESATATGQQQSGEQDEAAFQRRPTGKAAGSTSAGGAAPALMSLERFVVGDSNRMAHAAACEVVERPGMAYNPLFIHGSCGLGKTHLLQGIVNAFKQKGLGSRVQYVTAEEFTNRYIMAVKTHSLDAFRHRFRNLDVLVIDDIHFLANKTATQEEFLHTFNAFDVASRQVVMASDCHPKMLQSVQDNLINRFVSGMVVRLNPPDRQTRMEILRRKAEQSGHSINEDVISYIAQNITGSVRELEGAMIRVVAHAALDKQRISLEIAQRALGDNLAGSNRTPTVETVIDVVAQLFHTTRSDIVGHKRTRGITLPRQLAMFLVRRSTSMSLPEIGRAMGGKNHTTILAACRRVDSMYEADEAVTFNDAGMERKLGTRELVELIEDRIKGRM